MKDTIRLAGVIRESIVDGPGIRFTVFCQGCAHACPGCHNQETWDFEGGYDCEIEKILKAVDENPLLDGVTFSGGDPLFQAEAFSLLAEKVRERKLTVVTYTGFTYEELLTKAEKDVNVKRLLENTDLLIDGKFEQDKRDLTLQFRGSSNQRIIDMAKTGLSGNIVLADRFY